MKKKEIEEIIKTEEIINEVLEIVYEEISRLRENEGRIERLDNYIKDSIEEWKKRKFRAMAEERARERKDAR